jgi:hypothetical protein
VAVAVHKAQVQLQETVALAQAMEQKLKLVVMQQCMVLAVAVWATKVGPDRGGNGFQGLVIVRYLTGTAVASGGQETKVLPV